MVRFVFSFVVFLSLSFGLHSATATQADSSPLSLNNANPEGVIVEIHIVFGRQRPEGECRGFGISAQNDRTGFASASQTTNRKLKLVFDQNFGMSRGAYDTFFSKGKFLIEVDTVLPANVCRKLGLPEGYRIRPGNYPIERSGSTLTLIL